MSKHVLMRWFFSSEVLPADVLDQASRSLARFITGCMALGLLLASERNLLEDLDNYALLVMMACVVTHYVCSHPVFGISLRIRTVAMFIAQIVFAVLVNFRNASLMPGLLLLVPATLFAGASFGVRWATLSLAIGATVFTLCEWYLLGLGYTVRYVELSSILLTIVVVSLASLSLMAAVVRMVKHWDTDQQRMLADAEWRALHDPDTGLENFNAAKQRYTDPKRPPMAAMLLKVLDIDAFVSGNRPLEAEVLQRMVSRVAERMEALSHDAFRTADGALLFVSSEPVADADTLPRIMDSLLGSCCRPLEIGDSIISLSCAIGFSLAEDNDGAFGEDWNLETLYEQAVLAMPKTANNWRRYDISMKAQLERAVNLREALLDAIENAELSIVFQPKLSLKERRICGAEVLLRWHSQEFGEVEPTEFVALAEQSDAIINIGSWCLDELIAAMLRWTNEHHVDLNGLVMSINLSASHFMNEQFASDLIDRIWRSGLDPACFELEITEAGLMEDSRRVLNQLLIVRAAGIRVALDDFGTGYSSLSYLRRIPLDTLKIDLEFVHRLAQEDSSVSLVSSIIEIAKTFELETVAEGVENEQQAAILNELGCELAQGHLFSAPITDQQFVALLPRSNGISGDRHA